MPDSQDPTPKRLTESGALSESGTLYLSPIHPSTHILSLSKIPHEMLCAVQNNCED